MSGVFKELAKRDSQNIKHLAEDWNLPWLEAEARKNEKNPGRAIGKAATAAATWYLGGPLWESLGTAAPAAQGAAQAAQGAAPAAASAFGGMGAMTQEQLMQQAIQLAAQAPQQQGLLSSIGNAASGFKSGLADAMQGARGLLQPQSFAPGPGVAAPGMQGAARLDTALINAGFPEAAGGQATGLLGKFIPNSKAGSRLMMNQGMNLMNPPQQPMPAPPPPPPPQQQPQQNPYLEMTEEEKQRLRAMGYMVY